jgi:diacylglycerol O-acyltransferase / wax synthase
VVVRSLVPISVRGQDEHGVATNRVPAVLANLPVTEADPMRCLQLVREQMDEVKRTHQGAGAEVLTEMLGFIRPPCWRPAPAPPSSFPQPPVQTVTTNVPNE